MVINIDDIKDRHSYSLLREYSGKNPYILKLKDKLLKDNKLKLTTNQIKYIKSFHKFEPIKINKIIEITEYLGALYREEFKLTHTPNKILFDTIYAEDDKKYHILGKVYKNQKEYVTLWVPKTQVIDDPYFDKTTLEIDFEKYEKLDISGRKLFQHQKDGIKFLLSRKKCILSDPMGLGKSLQAIIASIDANVNKILVICPSSVKINWQREINNFCSDTSIIEGKRWNPAKYTIINYDILKNFHTIVDKRKKNEETEINRHIVNEKFDLIIIDESHFLKNNKSGRGKIVADIATNFPTQYVWLLSGTPITNKPMDYFNLLKIINHPLSFNWVFFAKRYCAARHIFRTMKNGARKKILATDGASNLEELEVRTRNFILRRKKEDALDMPPKIVTPVYNKLSDEEMDEYRGLWNLYVRKKIEKNPELNVESLDFTKELVELILLRQYTATRSIPYTIEMAENAIEQGNKVIIFTNFRDELEKLMEYFGKLAVCHHGGMNDEEKQESVDSFQNDDKIKVFIGNIKSAGIGINLTKGDVIIFNSLDWVPAHHEQAEDRSHRLGRDKLVLIYYNIFSNSIDYQIWETLKRKKDIISRVIGDNREGEKEIMEALISEVLKTTV